MLSETIQRWKREYRKEGLREGRKQGVKQGLKQGVKQGEIRMLLRLLEARFGELPDRARAHIQEASPERLEVWAKQAVHVTSLDALLDDSSSTPAIPRNR